MVGRRTKQGHGTDKRPLSFGARPWCDVPAAASQNQPSFVWHTQARYCACCLSRGGVGRELDARAPCRAGCGRSMHWVRASHLRGASLLRRAAVVRRPSCVLPESAVFCVARASTVLRLLSLERRRSTRAFCARAVPRWLWSAHALGKGTAPTRGLSPSARGRGATCQLLRLFVTGRCVGACYF